MPIDNNPANWNKENEPCDRKKPTPPRKTQLVPTTANTASFYSNQHTKSTSLVTSYTKNFADIAEFMPNTSMLQKQMYAKKNLAENRLKVQPVL